MHKRKLRQISQKREMALIAGALKGPHTKQFLSFLRANPAVAKILGCTLEHSRRSFSAAYPGQTRTRRVPNATWAKAGHVHVAQISRAMGLKGC